jgi:hypothetical protein
VNLYYQIRARNGAVAPTATTWTIGVNRVEDYVPSQVEIVGVRQQSSGSFLSVGVVTGNITSTAAAAPTVVAGQVIPAISATAAQGAIPISHTLVAAASNNATSLKASVGRLVGGVALNRNATTAYLKLFNKASAPTMGTDTPIFNIPLPANVPVSVTDLIGIYGFSFATGIAYAITAGQPLLDNTALAVAGDVTLNISYI